MNAKVYDDKHIDIVIFHGNCSDGFTAAAIAHQFGTHSDETVWISSAPCPAPPDVTGKNVVVMDLSFTYEDTMQCIEKAKSFIIIDHHKTAMKNLSDVPDKNKYFDMDKCGASLAWDYFSKSPKNSSQLRTIPRFVQYVEARDLWQQSRFEFTNEVWDLTHPKVQWVSGTLDDNNPFEYFQELMKDGPTSYALDNILSSVESIQEYKFDMLKAVVRSANIHTIDIDGQYKVVAYFTGPLYKDYLQV